MPIEVTPTPSPFPFQPTCSFRYVGPPRLPIQPSTIMPNGSRNPYPLCTVDAYRPSSDRALDRADQSRVGDIIASSLSARGDGGKGNSIVAPRSIMGHHSTNVGGLGGYRDDDGWNGSVGRIHMAHAPDLSSTAGAVHPRLPQPLGIAVDGTCTSVTSSFGSMPCSWGNRRRMTPVVDLEANVGPVISAQHPLSHIQVMQPGGKRSGAPVHHYLPGTFRESNHHRSKSLSRQDTRRRGSTTSRERGCSECQSAATATAARARSYSLSDHEPHHRRMSSSSERISPSPLNYMRYVEGALKRTKSKCRSSGNGCTGCASN
ncbi:hypothetical protein IAR55_006546 [Kwoniella newhampshirensis]|uniref:Uncharacterized protein n=1 Tax=Kwoniella newhampshirensis TaxID=1651941 RepID=A0AAW0YRG7_9TREE